MNIKILSLVFLCASALILPAGFPFKGNAAHAETFQEALISAYSHPRLQAERARLREIDETYVQAQSAGRLTSSISASVGLVGTNARSLNFATGAEIDGGVTTYPRNLQIEFIQPLYQGGRVRALKNQSKAGIMAARENLRQAEQLLFQEAAIAYVDVLRDEEVARTRRNNVKVLTRQLVAAQDRFDVGEGTLTDIAQAKSRLAGAEIGLGQADAALASSRAVYKQIIGHSPLDLRPVPTIALPASLDRALELAKTNNPNLIASRYNEIAAEAGLDVANSASRPRIGLVGSAQGAYDPAFGVSRSRAASLAAQVSIPIFTGGLNRSRKRAASEAKSRAKFETRNAQGLIQQSVAQIWAQHTAAQITRRASQTQVEAAEIAFEGVILEQDVGTRTTLDVLDAEQELLSAKLALIDARRGSLVAGYRLLTVLGAFDAESLQLAVNTYNAAENFDKVRYKGIFGDHVSDETETVQGDPVLNKDHIRGGEARVTEIYDTYISSPLEKIED